MGLLLCCKYREPEAVRRCRPHYPYCDDPRWNINGFETWCLSKTWLRVDYLRVLLAQGKPLPPCRDVAKSGVHIGIPPPEAQLYWPEYRWLSNDNPDRDLFHLRHMVEALNEDGALDSDLFFDYWTGCRMIGRRNPQSESVDLKFHHGQEAQAFHRVRVLVLPDVPSTETVGFFDEGWCIASFACSLYVGQVVTQTHELIREHTTPELVGNLARTFEKRFQKGATLFTDKNDWRVALYMQKQFAEKLALARCDAVGFQVSCHFAQFRWVKVWFVHELAQREGPMPRYQDLPVEAYIDGSVPEDVQPWVVSYSWSASLHPDPSGATIAEVSRVLQEHNAAESEVVFVDYMGLPQSGATLPAYYKMLNQQAVVESETSDGGDKVKLPPRTMKENRKFGLALAETTRLYAFAGGRRPDGVQVKGCKVIVVATIQKPDSFPVRGDMRELANEFCQPARMEWHTNWGFSKSVPYECGGWTCAEYSVARKNSTIINQNDKAVQHVESSRKWPTNVKEYAEMMDEGAPQPVRFTKRGDREAVRFNYYKFTCSLAETIT